MSLPELESARPLEGKALDEFLATNVMNWRRIGQDANGLPIYKANGDRTVHLSAWSPHADIAAAFEIVGVMRDRIYPYFFTLEHRPAGYACTFVRDDEHFGFGIKPAEAVCRAAILAISSHDHAREIWMSDRQR